MSSPASCSRPRHAQRVSAPYGLTRSLRLLDRLRLDDGRIRGRQVAGEYERERQLAESCRATPLGDPSEETALSRLMITICR